MKLIPEHYNRATPKQIEAIRRMGDAYGWNIVIEAMQICQINTSTPLEKLTKGQAGRLLGTIVKSFQ